PPIYCPQSLLQNFGHPTWIADIEGTYAPARYRVPRKNGWASTFRRVAGKGCIQRQKACKLKRTKKAMHPGFQLPRRIPNSSQSPTASGPLIAAVPSSGILNGIARPQAQTRPRRLGQLSFTLLT